VQAQKPARAIYDRSRRFYRSTSVQTRWCSTPI